jgi:release factor glutamine methyltransferase
MTGEQVHPREVVTVAQAVRQGATVLAAVSATPRLDAELLMAHALATRREDMLLSRLDALAPVAFERLVARRLAYEPVAYITGRRGFWTIELEVGPGVLVPRPDSETLIEAAVGHFGNTKGPRRILDLGTGPGTLLLAALATWPQATGLGVDASEEALAFARCNAKRLGLDGRAKLRRRDWATGIAERFDLILCNPPYVAAGADLAPDLVDWEPHQALFAGPDGLAAYRQLAPQVLRLLAPGGLACFEIGHQQAAAAGALFEAQGLSVSVRKDLAGRERCLLLRR